MNKKEFAVGEKVRMKKKHPCGKNLWEIIRIGMDFKIKCLKCNKIIMMTRRNFEKNFKEKVE